MEPLILLVDDEEVMLVFLENILKDSYNILTAGDGKQALALLEKEAINLVISDIMMPNMDGFELCQQIKSTVEYAQIPVILLTARQTLQSKVTGLELGADAFIEKPFSKEYLLAQIASLLYNRNKIREFFATSPLAFIQGRPHTKLEELFLRQLEAVITENMADPGLDVVKLARKMLMSRVTLYRKIKALSDLSPAELISISRLKRAAGLLAAGNFRIYEISEMVGFRSPGSFSRSFQRMFNMTPMEYAQTHNKDTTI